MRVQAVSPRDSLHRSRTASDQLAPKGHDKGMVGKVPSTALQQQGSDSLPSSCSSGCRKGGGAGGEGGGRGWMMLLLERGSTGQVHSSEALVLAVVSGIV